MRALIPALCVVFAGAAAAQDVEEGLAAWDAIYATAAHPRCSNCHVGASGTPGWAGLGFGEDARHGMAVQAGESRIGAESIPCRACHVTSDAPNNTPHAPPHVLDAWRLPPIELAWFGKSSVALCQQLRRPVQDAGVADLPSPRFGPKSCRPICRLG